LFVKWTITKTTQSRGRDWKTTVSGRSSPKEQAIEHARRRQTSPSQATPPEADHHQEPTKPAHKPTCNTKKARRRDRARSKLCRKSPDAETTPSEEALHLIHATIGEPHAESSKTVSSRRMRNKSAATVRSEDLRLSPGAPRRTERSRYEVFKKGTASADFVVAAREDPCKGFPLA
jgi:hypothetical protein